MNIHAIRVIFQREMARFYRTIMESLISPVISTSLYFVVFGAAIGSRIETVDGVTYGAFIVPGLIMLTVVTQSVSNASFAIHFPKFIGSIYELLSAPVSYLEIVIGYVGAAAVKSILIGLVILATAYLFVDLPIAHPIAMFALGQGFPAVATDPASGADAADLSRRQFLQRRHAARHLAHPRAVQSGGLPDVGVPLVVL
jgi:ABC-2 type transport system permease protein